MIKFAKVNFQRSFFCSNVMPVLCLFVYKVTVVYNLLKHASEGALLRLFQPVKSFIGYVVLVYERSRTLDGTSNQDLLLKFERISAAVMICSRRWREG